MPLEPQTPVEIAVATYIQASGERDAAARERLIAACWAVNGRLVTRSRVIEGRDALAAMLARFWADPQWSHIVLLSTIDAQGTTFRFRGAVQRHDGTRAEAFDAGEIDADGRISTILTFAGPLA